MPQTECLKQEPRGIAVGQLFPQQQTAYGAYNRFQTSKNLANSPANPYFSDFATGFNLSWEIDFWGKLRRSVESADDILQSSMDDYDNVMVTLIGDVATAYVQYRTFQKQIVYTQENVDLQRSLLKIATSQWKAGQKGELPVAQSASLLEQLEATIPILESGLRLTNNQMCVLIGIPPNELAAKLGKCANSRVAAGSNRRHSGGPHSPQARPPFGRTAGRGAERANRGCPGLHLSGLLHKRCHRLRGEGRFQTLRPKKCDGPDWTGLPMAHP